MCRRLNPILTTRFLLNLKQVNEGDSGAAESSHFASQISTVGFRIPQSMIGNLGEPIETAMEGEPSEDDSESLETIPDVSRHTSSCHHGEKACDVPGE